MSGDWLPPGYIPLGAPMPSPDPVQSKTIGDTLGTGAASESPLTDILSGGAKATTRGLEKVVSPETAQAITDWVVPQTPSDLGILIASMAVPEVKAGQIMFKVGDTMASKMLSRMLSKGVGTVAGMTAGGAAGGALGEGGETATSGATKGLVGGLVGAGLTKAMKMASYFPWIRRIAARDPEAVGQVVSGMVPEMGKVKTLKDFQSTFLHGLGQKRLSEVMETTESEISTGLGGKPVNAPSMLQFITPSRKVNAQTLSNLQAKGTWPVPFEAALDKVKTLRNEANRLYGADKGPQSHALKEAADAIEGEIVKSLPPELASKYLDAKKTYARGQTLLRFFGEKDLLTNDGLNMDLLQKKFRSQGMNASDATIAAGEMAQLQQSLFRDAETGSLVTDEEANLAGKFHIKGLSLPVGILSEKSFVGKEPNLPRRPLTGVTSQMPTVGGRMVSERPISLRKTEDSEDQ